MNVSDKALVASTLLSCDFTPCSNHQKNKVLTISNRLEISVKSGKDSTSTLSLVIHRVRFKKNLAKKKYISIQREGET